MPDRPLFGIRSPVEQGFVFLRLKREFIDFAILTFVLSTDKYTPHIQGELKRSCLLKICVF